MRWNDLLWLKKRTPGGLFDVSDSIDIVSRRSILAAPFGAGVVVTATEGVVELPSSASLLFAGLVIIPPETNLWGLSAYPDNHPIPVLQRGRVWVVPEQNVDPLKPVFLRHTANGLFVPGSFRTDDDSGRATQLYKARWGNAPAFAGDLAVLEINYP